jgi:hypothetical protein
MGDISLSGYKTIETVTWAAGQDLDSLTDNEWTALSDEEDNSTNKYMLADIEIVLASAAFTGTSSAIEVYLVPSVDGTNYPNWAGNVTTDEQENNIHFVGSVLTSGATEAQRLVIRNVLLPNGKFKFGVRNRGNVTTAASGNTLKYRPHQTTVA